MNSYRLSSSWASRSNYIARFLAALFLSANSISVYTSEITVDLPAAPPKIEEFSLKDLIEVGKREQSLKGEWALYQRNLETAFEEALAFENSSTSPELSRIAWLRFVEAFSFDNPYSDRDNVLLEAAKLKASAADEEESRSGQDLPSSIDNLETEDALAQHEHRDSPIQDEEPSGLSEGEFVFFLNNGDLLGVFSHNLSQTTLATEYPGFISDLEGYLSSGEYRDTQVLVFPDTNDINTSLEISSIKLFLNFLAQKKPRLSKLFSEYPWTYFEYGKSGKFALSTRTLLLTSDGKPGAWRPRHSYGDLQKAPPFLMKVLDEFEEYKRSTNGELEELASIKKNASIQAATTEYWKGLNDYLIESIANDYLSDIDAAWNDKISWILLSSNHFSERYFAFGSDYTLHSTPDVRYEPALGHGYGRRLPQYKDLTEKEIGNRLRKKAEKLILALVDKIADSLGPESPLLIQPLEQLSDYYQSISSREKATKAENRANSIRTLSSPAAERNIKE